MNSLNTPSTLTSSEGDFQPDEFWQLKEPSLFPVKPGDWPELTRLPARLRPKIVGNKSYDLFVNHRSRRPVVAVIRKMMPEFREDFEVASTIFEPAQWRQLFYMDMYPIATLGQPDFDGKQIFHRIFAQDSWTIEAPPDWIGSTASFDEIMQQIRLRIDYADPDQLKTVWAILSFARSLAFEKNDVLKTPWWTCWWIETYLCADADSD